MSERTTKRILDVGIVGGGLGGLATAALLAGLLLGGGDGKEARQG